MEDEGAESEGREKEIYISRLPSPVILKQLHHIGVSKA